MIKSKTLLFDNDSIELFENDLLSSRPYLIRLTGWNDNYDFRASKDDLIELANSILSFVETKSDSD